MKFSTLNIKQILRLKYHVKMTLFPRRFITYKHKHKIRSCKCSHTRNVSDTGWVSNYRCECSGQRVKGGKHWHYHNLHHPRIYLNFCRIRSVNMALCHSYYSLSIRTVANSTQSELEPYWKASPTHRAFNPIYEYSNFLWRRQVTPPIWYYAYDMGNIWNYPAARNKEEDQILES